MAKTRLLERAWCWHLMAASKLTGSAFKQAADKAIEVEKLLPSQQRPVVLYAMWGADNGWTDVTDRVRSLIVLLPGQKAAFNPSDLHIPSDPAPGKPKALVVVYRYRGWVFLSTTGEGDAAAVPAGFGPLDTPPVAPKPGQDVTILHARYGADNGWEQKTANAQQQVVGGTLTGMPGDLGFGDPAFGKAKAMVLVYRYGGKVRLMITGQGDRASIGAPAVNP